MSALKANGFAIDFADVDEQSVEVPRDQLPGFDPDYNVGHYKSGGFYFGKDAALPTDRVRLESSISVIQAFKIREAGDAAISDMPRSSLSPLEGLHAAETIDYHGQLRIRILFNLPGGGVQELILSESESIDVWAELSRMRVVEATPVHNENLTFRQSSIAMGKFWIVFEADGKMARRHGRPIVATIPMNDTANISPALVPIILAVDGGRPKQPGARAARDMMFWNQPERAIEAFIQGWMERMERRFRPYSPAEALRRARRDAFEVLQRVRSSWLRTWPPSAKSDF